MHKTLLAVVTRRLRIVNDWLGRVAVLVPVKAFADAKLRLAPALPAAERSRLAQTMAAHVLEVARPLPVAVVCDDAAVADWARRQGALVVWEPGRGLNGAVQAGVERLAEAGARHVIVAHGDLPLAGPLAWASRFPGVTLVPDRRDDGTNVASVPADAGFTFSYGPGSFQRHGAEALRLGLGLRVVREPLLGHDVDVPADLLAGVTS
jgi:2-phospho-L-lactate guanylyltransferase